MKQNHSDPSDISPILLDLLVDGELSESERRELLLRLDHIPDGWRQCAIAFLESQCWQECLGGASKDTPQGDDETRSSVLFASLGEDLLDDKPPGVQERLEIPEAQEQTPHAEADKTTRDFNSPSGSSALRKWKTPVAMAAGFVLAIFLGFLMKEGMNISPVGPGGTTIAGTEDAKRPSENGQTEKQPPSVDYRRAPFGPDPVEARVDPWQQVTLKSPENGGQEIHIPCYETETFPPTRHDGFSTLFGPDDFHLPPSSLTSHKIQKYPRLMISLGDGRYLVVPIDHLEVDYPGISEQE